MKCMKTYPVTDNIKQFASVFKENGFSLYIVGGAVRDFLLGIKSSDYDFCTDALPEQVMSMFRKVIPTGIKHGTVTFYSKRNPLRLLHSEPKAPTLIRDILTVSPL